MSEPQSRNLDVLRAFAVGSVFIGHALETFRYHDNLVVGSAARFGVMAFFVHTALVLMRSLERQDADGRGNLTGRFYVRRLFRIYPLSIACVAAVALFGIPYMPWRPVVAATGRVIASNLSLTMNLAGTQPVLGPLWSLPFEVQMYLALPLCYFLVKKSRMNPFLLWLLGVLLFAPPIMQLRELVKFVPCFLAGVIAYVQIGKMRRIVPAFCFPFFIVIVCACYAIAIPELAVYGRGWRYEQLGLLAIDWLCSLTIGLALPFFAEMSFNWTTRAAYQIAKYSYGIYLSHVPVMWFVLVKMSGQPLALRTGVFLLGVVAIPVAAYHLLEAPMIEVGKRLTKGRRRSNPTAVDAVAA